VQLRIDAAARCRCLGKTKEKVERTHFKYHCAPASLLSGTGTSCARVASLFPHGYTCPAFACPPCFLPCSLRCGFGLLRTQDWPNRRRNPHVCRSAGITTHNVKSTHTHTIHTTIERPLPHSHHGVQVDDCTRALHLRVQAFFLLSLFFPLSVNHSLLLALASMPILHHPPPFPHQVFPIHRCTYYCPAHF
jgi:hypothetical protein